MLPLAPGLVLDDVLLAETLRQPIAHQARLDVGRAAGGEADDDAGRPSRIGVGPRDAGQGRQGSRTRGQMHECAATKRHDALPTYATLRTLPSIWTRYEDRLYPPCEQAEEASAAYRLPSHRPFGALPIPAGSKGVLW